MKTENHISILRGLLPDDYTADDNGRIYSDGQPLDIYYTPEHFFEVNVGNAEELIALEQHLGGFIPMPQAVSGDKKPLFTHLADALRFLDGIEHLQGLAPELQYWTRRDFAALKEQLTEQDFAVRVFKEFNRPNKISIGLNDFLPSLKKALAKIDNDKMLAFVAEQMGKIKLPTDDQQQLLAKGADLIRHRINEIKMHKTLCSRLRKKFIEAYCAEQFDVKPKYRSQPLIEHLYGMCGHDDLRPIGNGVYNDPKGWYVATNAAILAAVAADRISSNQESGTVVTKDGKKIDGTYYNWQAIIPKDDSLHEFALNALDFWQWLTLRQRQAKLKGCNSCWSADNVSLIFSHTPSHNGFKPQAGFDLEYLLQFVSAAMDLGKGKFYYNEAVSRHKKKDGTMDEVVRYMLVYKTDDSVPSYILLMALESPPQQIDTDYGVYFDNCYDAAEAAPSAEDDNRDRQRKLLKLKAKAIKMKLELMKI